MQLVEHRVLRTILLTEVICKKMKTLKIILPILVLSLLQGCGKEVDVRSEKVYKTIHYRATASGSDVSKASLNASDQYIFEATDRLFVCDAATGGTNLYGALTLVSGAGERVAYFEGDLACAEDFDLLSTTPISVTLVGVTGNTGTDKIHTVSGGKLIGTSYPDDLYASTLTEAVQKFSNFTCSSTFGATTFTLSQQSTFLVCSVKMSQSDLPVDTDVTVSLENASSTVWEGTVTSAASGSVSRLSFVIPFEGGTALSDASLACSWTGGIGSMTIDDIADEDLLANRYYNITRSTFHYDGFRITAIQDNTDVTFNYCDANIEYSLDSGETWTAYTTIKAIKLGADEDICFRGQRSDYKNIKNDEYETPNTTPVFTATKKCYISGNVMSLLADDDDNEATIAANAFNGAFSKGTSSINYIDIHPTEDLILPATILGEKCYKNMFRYCTNLTRLPDLPATTVSVDCYRGMFRQCTSLQTVSLELPADELQKDCYREMFRDCSGLTSVSKGLLPATQLAETCYQQMFSACQFATPPDLPATTLATGCYYQMFSTCTLLTTSPDLNAPTLVATCYFQMFVGCSSLANVKCLATTKSASQCTSDWLKNVSASGTFTRDSGTTWSRNASGIPSGWTVDPAM